MTVRDALPGDVYVDDCGKLWRIIAICTEPTVMAEEVEGTLYDPNAGCQQVRDYAGAVSMITGSPPPPAEIRKSRLNGAVGAAMWRGFTRIWRHPSACPRQE